MHPAASVNAFLHLLGDDGRTAVPFDLIGGKTFRLGRTEASDIPLPFPWVSRQHAMIQIEENGSCNLIDLGSSNGTSVNGKRIVTPTRLHSDDRISIGRTTLVFIQVSEPFVEETSPGDEDSEEKTVAFVQRKLVTVLICDIHDYTKLSELLGDALISQLIRIWSSEVDKCVRHHDGLVDKFLGDAVMAIWTGGPSPRQSIMQALRTALEISQLTRILGKKNPLIPGELTIGAAINTGEAVVGSVGSDGRRDFTVIGDAVNVAFRLESMTSQTGYDLLIGKEAATYLDAVDSCFIACSCFLKGKEKKVPACGCSFHNLKKYLTS